MANIWENLAGLQLRDAQPVVYERPVGLRRLHQDPATGAEHYLIRYPAGLVAHRHRHSAAQREGSNGGWRRRTLFGSHERYSYTTNMRRGQARVVG